MLGAAKPIHDGPTPIRPIPRNGATAEKGDKFGPPSNPGISPRAPPPAALPQGDDVASQLPQ
jgi:hypothetical protein